MFPTRDVLFIPAPKDQPCLMHHEEDMLVWTCMKAHLTGSVTLMAPLVNVTAFSLMYCSSQPASVLRLLISKSISCDFLSRACLQTAQQAQTNWQQSCFVTLVHSLLALHSVKTSRASGSSPFSKGVAHCYYCSRT